MKNQWESELKEKAWREVTFRGEPPKKDSTFPKNSIKSSSYLLFYYSSIKHQVKRVANFWYLVVSVALLASDNLELSGILLTFLPLGLIILLNLVVDFYKLSFRLTKESKVDSETFLVWNGEDFKEKLCRDILVGDILVLRNQELAPADFMILSYSPGEIKCLVDTCQVFGDIDLKVKTPVKDFQENLHQDLDQITYSLKNLYFDLKVKDYNSEIDQFFGKLKIDGFPQASEVSLENLILRGSVVYSDWVMGIALYTGKDSYVFKNSLRNPQRVTCLEKRINTLTWVAVGLLLTTLVLIECLYYEVHSEPFYETMVYNAVYMSGIVPLCLLLVLDAVALVQGYCCQSKFNFKKFNESLGKIDYVLTEKSSIVASNELFVSLCLIGANCFWNDNPQKKKLLEEQLNCEPSSPAKRIVLPAQGSPNSPYHQVSIENQGNFESEVRNHENSLIFLKCLAMCNHSISHKCRKKYFEEDNLLEYFLVSLGGSVKHIDNLIQLNFEFETYEFKVLAYQNLHSDLVKSKIVVEELNDRSTYLFVRGPKEEMLPLFNTLNPFNKQIYSVLREENLEGERLLLYGFWKLDEFDKKDFLESYEEACFSPLNSEEKVEKVFEKFEQNLTYVGGVGLQEDIPKSVSWCFSELKQTGVKIWLLSGDRPEVTQSTGIASGIISPSLPVVQIQESESLARLKVSMESAVKSYLFDENEDSLPNDQTLLKYSKSHNNLLKSEPKNTGLKRSNTIHIENRHPVFSKVFKKSKKKVLKFKDTPKPKKFNLLVSSRALNLALSSNKAKLYLSALLYYANSATFSSLFAFQKRQVASFVKDLTFDPVILGVYKSEGELAMVSKIDASICIDESGVSLQSTYSDLCVSSICELKEVLLDKAYNFYLNLQKTLLLCFYLSFLVFACSVVLGFCTEFSGEFFSAQSFSLVAFGILVGALVFLGLFDRNPKVLSLPKQKDLDLKTLAFEALEAGVHASVLILGLKLAFKGPVNSKGQTEYLEMLYCSFLLAVFLTVSFKTILRADSVKVKLVVWHSIGFCVLGGLIWMRSGGVFGTQDSFLGVLCNFFSAPLAVISVFGLALVNFTLTLAIKCFKAFFWHSTKSSQKHPSIYSIYKSESKNYRKKEETQFQINTKKLKFESESLENEYLSGKLNESLTKYRVVVLVIFVWFIFFQVWAFSYIRLKMGIGILVVFNLSKILLFVYLSYSKTLKKHTSLSIFCYGVYLLVVESAICIDILEVSPIIFVVNPVLFYIALYVTWIQANSLNTLSYLVFLVNSYLHFKEKHTQQSEFVFTLVYYNILFFAINATCANISYQQNYSDRKKFSLAKLAHQETRKANSVVHYLFPKFVAKSLVKDQDFVCSEQQLVSIMFCNICEFDQIVNYFSPMELTAFLDSVFQKFDRLCNVIGVSKIETVGYTYMACAGITEFEKELDPALKSIPHPKRALELAEAMIREAEETLWKTLTPLKLKIGVHSGEVTAGLVGYHKPQFALVGDTVNTASRMASTVPLVNVIQISESTFENLESVTDLEITGRQVNVKGKGLMNTYLIRSTKNLKKKYLTISTASSRLLSMRSMKPNESSVTVNKKLFSLQEELDDEKYVMRKNSEVIESVKFFSLQCVDKGPEKEFRKEVLKNSLIMHKRNVLIFFSVTLLASFVLFCEYLVKQQVERLYESIRTFLLLVVLGTFLLFSKKCWKSQCFGWTVQIITLFIPSSYLLGFIIQDKSSESDMMVCFYHLLILTHCSVLFLKHIVTTALILYTITLVYMLQSEYSNLIDIAITTTFVLVTIVTSYFREKSFRKFSTTKTILEKKLETIDSLLKRMLPSHVYEHLKEENVVTDRYTEMTMLYADIVGFTSWSSGRMPDEVLGMLNVLFKQFDEACEKHSVYKVHTIGDCYVVLGNTGELRDPSKEAYNVVCFAKEMISVIKEINQKYGFDLDMRIGVHTGEVTAGISGTSIVRYDIYGEDVSIANEIESKGIPGCVVVSAHTKELLESTFEEFSFEDHAFVYTENSEVETFKLIDN